MKRKIISALFLTGLAVINTGAYAQMYYTASSTELIQNSGKDWVQKKLPSSIIMFSDNSGQAELKMDISSLIEKDTLATVPPQTEINNLADFKFNLDKQKIISQLYSGQIFNTVGTLTINSLVKPVTMQYFLRSSGDYENGFTISVIIRFVPKDFNIKFTGEPENIPTLLRIDDGVVSEI